MVLITVIVGVTAEFLVDSINGLVEAHPSLSQEWVGLILLPIVSEQQRRIVTVTCSISLTPGRQRSGAFHRGIGFGQGQARPVHLRCGKQLSHS